MPLTDEERAALRAEMLADLKKEIPAVMGEAFKSDGFKTAIGGIVADGIKGAGLDDLKAQVAGLAKPAKGKAKEGDAATEPDDVTVKRLEALETQLRERDQALAAEKARARSQAAETAVRDALVSAGFPADAVPRVLPYLRANGFIKDDGETPTFKGRDAYGVEGFVPVADGVKGWLSTDDGKAWIPAKGIDGTGERGPVRGAGGQSVPGQIGGVTVKTPDDLRKALGLY